MDGVNASCVSIDYFENVDSGQRFTLVSGTSMMMCFATAVLFSFFILARTVYIRVRSRVIASRSNTMVHYSPFWGISVAFYAFILLFSLGRFVFYALRTIDCVWDIPGSGGLSEDMLIHLESSIFHWASTAFYSSFLFLNLRITSIYLMIYGSGAWQAYKALRIPRILAVCAGIALFALQALLTLVLVIMVLVSHDNDPADGKHPQQFNFLSSAQLIFHGVASSLCALVFIAWALYSTKLRLRLNQFRPQYQRVYRLQIFVSAVIAGLLVVKGLANFAFGAMAPIVEFCQNTQEMIFIFLGVWIDLVPLLAVIFILSQTSTVTAADSDYIEAEEAANRDAPPLLLKRDESHADEMDRLVDERQSLVSSMNNDKR